MNNVLLKLTPHSVILSKQTIEIRDRDNGTLLGTITQGDRINTVRILSKHGLSIQRVAHGTMTVLEIVAEV